MAIQLLDKDYNFITDWLIEITDDKLICNCDSIDLLPIGSIIDFANCNLNWLNVEKECYIVNKADLKNIKINNEITHGCCGSDGDVLNIFDNNLRSIGYEYGDCYMSHFIKIPKNNVTIKKEQRDNPLFIFAITEYKNKQKIIDRIVGFDYEKIIQQLQRLIDIRLKWEINDTSIENEIKSKVKFYDLDNIKHLFTENNNDLWLYTKYDKQ